MAVRNAISTQRQFLVRVSGINGYFSTKGGGEVEADTSKAWDGGQLAPEVLSSPAETSNITVSRPYRPTIHQANRKRLSGLVGRWRTTISVQDVDADMRAIGRPTTYADALLVRASPPEVDAASGDTAMWELEFAVSGEA